MYLLLTAADEEVLRREDEKPMADLVSRVQDACKLSVKSFAPIVVPAQPRFKEVS